MQYKRFFLASLLTLLALLLVAEPAVAQRANDEVRPSPNAKVSQTIGTTEIDMHYGRPGVKGRTVFGDLQAWDTPWRAGANEPTTITFSDDVQFEGESVPAGTYNLFIEPHETGTWDVILHEVVGWGTMYDADKEVLRVAVTPEEGPHQEWLRYTFEDLNDTGATLQMRWADRVVPVRIETAN